MKTLKYQFTPDGVHVWRYENGDIFCAASGQVREQTNCYPLAKQYVEGAAMGALPAPGPSPSSGQPGDVVSLVLLLLAIACAVIGGVTLSYVLAPVDRVDRDEPDESELEPDEPVIVNPDGSQGSEGSGSEKGHERVTEGSEKGQESTPQGSDDEDDLNPSTNEGSSRFQESGLARMSLAEFKEAVPCGNLDPRTLSLAEYREMAKEIVWRFYLKSGVTNRQKLAWICTGATKGGSQAWQLTDQFLKEVCPIMFTWGYSPKYQTTDGGF